MSGNSIRDIFFQECEDLSDALTDGLNDIADGTGDNETVNAVFRAVHSIKGSGGAFGLEDLVGFAHKFETVLDAVRSGTLTINEQLTDVLLRSGDVLIELIDAARMETEINQAAVDAATTALNEFLIEEDEPEEEFTFEPMVLDIPGPAEIDGERTDGFDIDFAPTRNFYEVGNEPQHLFSALKGIGELSLVADASNVPDDLEEGDWESSYLKWRLNLRTEEKEGVIAAVFSFVDDLCEITITRRLSALDQTPVESAAESIVISPSRIVEEDHKKGVGTGNSQEQIAIAKSAPASNNREAKATLRVDLERVDRLINSVGELIINQSVIAQRIQDAGLGKSDDIQVDLEDYKHLAREIQEGVMAIRAQPVKPLFQRMARIVREVASSTGKKVQLVTQGEATEVDKTLVERLSDPLTHMIRNAIDHGIEDEERRLAAGKPTSGTVTLSAQHRSGSVLIEITDDGAGLDRERIKNIAVEKGIVNKEAELTDGEIDQLLFAPGFSTAKEVTNLSGRGVGMDVVKTAISALGGRIGISSIPGNGSTFSINLPLTLAVMDGMVVDVGQQTMVVPVSSIIETIQPKTSEIFQIGDGNPILRVRGEYVPIVDVAIALGQLERAQPLAKKVLLLVRTEKLSQCAFVVDSISDQRQVVIKSLQGSYGKIPGISAATILGDGKIALIIDPDGIADSVPSKGVDSKGQEAVGMMEVTHA
ncbi:MAG: chemotaxis protein CheA [Yoonia sp.]|uniref:chemotaxis protein CheA n=1 Tax=Yoonia sp. TaxID=2212373 RepID=UPI003267C24B